MKPEKKPLIVPARDTGKRLQILMGLEAEARRQNSVAGLSVWAVNEPRQILDFSQAIMFRFNRSGRLRAVAVSSLAVIDRNAPFIRWMEKRIEGLVGRNHGKKPAETCHILLSRTNDADSDNAVYPFKQTIWVPLTDRHGQVFAGILMSRVKSWDENDLVIAERLGEVIAHCFQALVPRGRLRLRSMPKWVVAGVVAAFIAAMFIPVPMTTLAPAEIIADDPQIISAPIDGVIREIFADPNSIVHKGDKLFAFDTIKLQAEADIAERKELVARARLATIKQTAFSDPQAYRQLAINKAEVDLAEAEREFAKDRLQRAIVRAGVDGHLIYTERKDWIGKPVSVGDRVMEVADLNRIVVRIDLPVGDAISLHKGADVRLFLNSDPLNPVKARLRQASYHAREIAGAGMVYQVLAELAADDAAGLRVGLRGTAQIFGDDVLLGFYLFRKPLSTLRQYFGI